MRQWLRAPVVGAGTSLGLMYSNGADARSLHVDALASHLAAQGERLVDYERDDWPQLQLAYAITSQREHGPTARELAQGAITRFLGQLRETEALASHQRPGRVAGDLTTQEIERLIDNSRLVAGNPDEVADMLAYLQSEVGFTQVDLMFQFGGLAFETARESMELFAAEVMPRLRAHQPAASR